MEEPDMDGVESAFEAVPEPDAAVTAEITPVAATAPDVTSVMPAAAQTAPSADAPHESPAVYDVPADRAWPLLGRVLVLPRSTFRRVAAQDSRVWPLAFGVLALSALLKTLVAAGVAVAGGGVATRLAAVVGVRYGAALVGPLLFAAAAAAALKMTERWWHGDAPFGLLLSATSLTLMPLAVRNVLQAVYMGVTRAPLVHPGLSALLGGVPHSALGRVAYGLLAQVDLFTLWAFVLLALAVGVTHGRHGFRRILVIALFVVVWLAVAMLPSFAVAALAA